MRTDVGDQIRSLRQRLSVTQEELARALEVTVSTVNRWENGHAEPSRLAWKAVQEFARRCGLSAEAFRAPGVSAEA